MIPSSFFGRARAVRRGVCAFATFGGLAVTLAAAAAPGAAGRFVPGLSFRISSTTSVFAGDTPRGQADEIMRGRGVAANNRSRIEFLAFTPTPQGITTDDFLIGADSGKAFILHSANQRVTPAADMFNGPAVIALGRVLGGGAGRDAAGGGGGGGGAARGGRGGPPGGGGGGARGGRGGRGARGGFGGGFLSQLQLLDVSFTLEKLGTETVDGHQAQHYRVVTDYRVLWGDQAFPAHAVTEIWSTPLPTNIPNPFEPFIVADQSTDGPLIEYALKLRTIRAQVEGTPIKVITTTTFTGIHDIAGFSSLVGTDPAMNKVTVVQQTQITAIAPADVDVKLLSPADDGGTSPIQ